MLVKRIQTAVALLMILVPAMFAPNLFWFGLVTAILIGAAAWEWGGLNQQSHRFSSLGGVVAFVLMGFYFWSALEASYLDGSFLAWLWFCISACWISLSLFLLPRTAATWLAIQPQVRWVLGLLLLIASWMALLEARKRGVNFLLSVMCLVWVADIAAYFAGKTWGGRWFPKKLASSISPGKTWEGVVGAGVAVMVIGWIWRVGDSVFQAKSLSIYSLLMQIHGSIFLLSLLLLTATSVVGDLLESFFKRSAGVKDSSGLLPGHGGVLDRIDALLPVLPLAMLITSLLDSGEML